MITLTSFAGITLLIALLAAVLLAGVCVNRHRAANFGRWSPPSWWARPVDRNDSLVLRNTVREITAPNPFVVTSIRDARVVTVRMLATRSPRRLRADRFKLSDPNPMGRRVARDRRTVR